MTRFFVKTELETTVKRLINCLKDENYTYRISNFGTVSYKIIQIQNYLKYYNINYKIINNLYNYLFIDNYIRC